jgi:long-subunit acyl-CoA synthetase (AMP-forming)
MLETQHVPVLLTYGLRSCGKLISEGDSENTIERRGEPTPDSVAVMFSSGTTAKRKSVELSYASIMITHRKIKSKNVLFSRNPGRPMLEVFPMSHVSGLFSAYTLLNEGMSIATVDSLSSDTIMEAFKVFRPMAFGMVPKVHELFISRFEDELKKKHIYNIPEGSDLNDSPQAEIRTC